MQKVTQTSPYRRNARMRDRGLVGAVTGIAEERWRVGACDLGLAKERGRVRGLGTRGSTLLPLQWGQGREVPRGHTSPVLRPLGLLCVSRAAAPRGAGPHQKSRGGGGTWAETVPTCLNL